MNLSPSLKSGCTFLTMLKIRLKKVSLALALTALSATAMPVVAVTQPATTESVQSSRALAELSRYVQEMARKVALRPNFSSLQYALIENNTIVLSGYAGENDTPLDHETVYAIGSVSKMFGAASVMKLVQDAAKVLANAGFDIEIVEKHHNKKLDAPSGTALALADSINEAMDERYHYKYDRSTERVRRDENEIGISAVRGGTIVGDHDVILAGTVEVSTFSHTAYSKAIFGKGALQAALFLAGKEPGMYDMQDVIG